MIESAVAAATRLGAPVNVVIVDESGVDLAMVRMDGAKFLSIETARAKAQTAASHRRPTTKIPSEIASGLAFASGGRITDMAGGLPVMFDGACVGGVGIGSASDEDDIEIALAALSAIGADRPAL
ncbi:heme-binding protein [Chelatococcus sambhunathii]|uniref:Heme-binding protein n=2 Tax=Chelatococcus sambhunathii TaxID=363953 RepID=A0ABU1DDK8_9HYPH|nr:heme-binding protein [Chelatococcus sambhunathii]